MLDRVRGRRKHNRTNAETFRFEEQANREPIMIRRLLVPPREEVHCWLVNLDESAEISNALALLSPDERERSHRFRFDRDRGRFIQSRAALRTLLGQYLDVAPQNLRFEYNPEGKPSLKNAPALCFNLSHSATFAAIAVGGAPVGVDIECLREVDVNIAEKYFSPDEASSIARLPLESQQEAFFRVWTRKEALVKALGVGLGLALDSFSVSLDDDAVLLRLNHAEEGIEEWTLLNLEAGPGICGAIAVRSQTAKLCFMQTLDLNQ